MGTVVLVVLGAVGLVADVSVDAVLVEFHPCPHAVDIVEVTGSAIVELLGATVVGLSLNPPPSSCDTSRPWSSAASS